MQVATSVFVMNRGHLCTDEFADK